MAEENDLARRGYSRDHRSDCKQIVLALIVTREGFPLAHLTLAGNTQDLQTVETIVKTIETRFGKSQRVWVMDRGMISKDTLKFLSRSGRRYLLATRRGELASFAEALARRRLAAPPRQSRGRSEAARSGSGCIICWHGAGRGVRRSGRFAAVSGVGWPGP